MKRISLLLALLGVSLLALWQRSKVQAAIYGIHSDSLVGRVAPEIPASVPTLDGAPLRLAALRGRVVLLHFWTFG